MADQIELTKLNQFAGIGVPAAQASVAKLVMFVLLEPGSSEADTSNKQGHVHTQLIRRG